MVVPSPLAVMENVPVLLDVYVYVPLHAGEPPGGGVGTVAMNGPAIWPRPFVVCWVRSVSAAGSAPMWAAKMLTDEPRVRVSACALATRARVWTLAYSGIAMAARMPMMATTIISSMSVKPCWVLSAFLFSCQKLNMDADLLCGLSRAHGSDRKGRSSCSPSGTGGAKPKKPHAYSPSTAEPRAPKQQEGGNPRTSCKQPRDNR